MVLTTHSRCLFVLRYCTIYSHLFECFSSQSRSTVVPVYVCISELYKRYNKLCYKRLCHCFNVRTRFTHNHLDNAGHLPDKALHYPTDLSLLPFYGYLPYRCETYSKRIQIGAKDLWIRDTDYSSQLPLFKIGVPPQQRCSTRDRWVCTFLDGVALRVWDGICSLHPVCPPRHSKHTCKNALTPICRSLWNRKDVTAIIIIPY